MPKTILITGATAGFGKAIAEKFASAQYNLIITGRRKELLADLAKQLKTKFKIEVLELCFDVQKRKQVFDSIGVIKQPLDILVNNAGLALGRDSFDEADLDDWDTMIDTNLKGLLYVTRACIPMMEKADTRHIINIGSIAGKEIYEKGNVYCSSKHAVDSISMSMRVDLLKKNFKVTAIHPGAAETEFSKVRFKGDEAIARSVYQGLKPLTARDVAEVVYYTASLPPHVCINDLVLTCTQQANSHYFNRTL